MRGAVFVWGAMWAEEGQGIAEVRARGVRVLLVLGGFGFARVGVVELDEILLNPACAFDELGQCRGRPEVEEL